MPIRVKIMSALVLVATCMSSAGLLGAPDDPHQRLATRILEATGVKGGLVVHVGCGEGQLTAALRANRSYLVHGLDADPGKVEAARDHIQSLGLYGPVSADTFDGQHLPYTDDLMRLLVVEGASRVSSKEAARVLAPGGVMVQTKRSVREAFRKPWPTDIDEWTHFLHDAGGNAVAHDDRGGPSQAPSLGSRAALVPQPRNPHWCQRHRLGRRARVHHLR